MVGNRLADGLSPGKARLTILDVDRAGLKLRGKCSGRADQRVAVLTADLATCRDEVAPDRVGTAG